MLRGTAAAAANLAEENGYHPHDAAKDFAILHQVIMDKFPHNSTRPKIIGPDIMMQSWNDPSSTKAQGYISYLTEFVRNCSLLGVDLYAVTHHEYLEIQEYATTPPPALLLDEAGTMGRAIRAAIKEVAPTVKVWAGEIGPHPGTTILVLAFVLVDHVDYLLLRSPFAVATAASMVFA